MNFGVMNTFDSGQCSGPYETKGCLQYFKQYGYYVGCENWVSGSPANFPHQQWDGLNHYPGAQWYSIPGACPSKTYKEQDASCKAAEPGGECVAGTSVPTGGLDCTYTIEQVGELSIDELEGITDYADFIKSGGREYDPTTDKGVHMSFWDGLKDKAACQRRIDTAEQKFKAKYPDQPDLSDPVCNFNKYKFYPGMHP